MTEELQLTMKSSVLGTSWDPVNRNWKTDTSGTYMVFCNTHEAEPEGMGLHRFIMN